ncbi:MULTISPECIES: hypothetical protein [unclassified Isoptericola]|uniref:hypothetical protein n=1 Tax=unclassified Isoptericola TaxID=2623355 RepID=UPI0035E62123|nr:hypothetical protein [Isoptericola sp. QY 916]
MTTTTAPSTPDAGTLQRVASAAVRRRFVRRLLAAGAWFWGIWAFVVAVVPAAVDRWGGELVGLTYELAGAPARWVALAVAAVYCGAWLRGHLAAGGTRRSLVIGVLQGAAIVGPVFGVLTVLLTLAEERVFRAIDEPWPGGATPVPLDTVAGIVVTIVGETLVVLTYALVGAAAIGYYRAMPARLYLLGPLHAVPLLVPLAIVDLSTRTGLLGIPLRGGYDDPVVAALVVAGGGVLAVAVAGVGALRLMARVRVRP